MGIFHSKGMPTVGLVEEGMPTAGLEENDALGRAKWGTPSNGN